MLPLRSQCPEVYMRSHAFPFTDDCSLAKGDWRLEGRVGHGHRRAEDRGPHGSRAPSVSASSLLSFPFLPNLTVHLRAQMVSWEGQTLHLGASVERWFSTGRGARLAATPLPGPWGSKARTLCSWECPPQASCWDWAAGWPHHLSSHHMFSSVILDGLGNIPCLKLYHACFRHQQLPSLLLYMAHLLQFKNSHWHTSQLLGPSVSTPMRYAAMWYTFVYSLWSWAGQMGSASVQFIKGFRDAGEQGLGGSAGLHFPINNRAERGMCLSQTRACLACMEA